MNKIVSAVGRRVDESQPLCDARLLDGSGRPVGRVEVVSAAYSEVFRRVQLTLATPLPRDARFRLRIRGRGPGGLTDRRGNFLNGANRRAARGRGARAGRARPAGPARVHPA